MQVKDLVEVQSQFPVTLYYRGMTVTIEAIGMVFGGPGFRIRFDAGHGPVWDYVSSFQLTYTVGRQHYNMWAHPLFPDYTGWQFDTEQGRFIQLTDIQRISYAGVSETSDVR